MSDFNTSKILSKICETIDIKLPGGHCIEKHSKRSVQSFISHSFTLITYSLVSFSPFYQHLLTLGWLFIYLVFAFVSKSWRPYFKYLQYQPRHSSICTVYASLLKQIEFIDWQHERHSFVRSYVVKFISN